MKKDCKVITANQKSSNFDSTKKSDTTRSISCYTEFPLTILTAYPFWSSKVVQNIFYASEMLKRVENRFLRARIGF